MTHGDSTLQRVLPNGLTAIARQQTGAPIASLWVWYRVGGRNEVAGITGISHWLEHMQFKGTDKIGPGEIFRTITANGGAINGFTWLDYTAYYETLPIDKLDVGLEIESDRMVNSRISADEVASERTVIISERQGNENNPGFLLSEEIAGAAFRAHPYGNGVIGHISDLQAITREDLCAHYRRYYAPNNAVVVIVGALPADEALDRIEAAFGDIPRGEEVPMVRTIEPPQYGERRVQVHRPAPNRVVQIVYRAPEAAHVDTPALLVAEAVLSGGKPFSFGGGAAMGRSSRLYRALVAKGLASGAGASMSLSIDPYIFGVSATLSPDSDADQVESILNAEVQRLVDEPVGTTELERVRKQIRAQFVYSQQSASSKAYLLGALAVVAPEMTPDDLLDAMLAVTPEELQRAAATWLVPNHRTTGWLIPSDASGQPASASVGSAPAGYVPDANDLGLDSTMPAARETRMPNGVRVLTLDDQPAEQPVVARIRVPGGSSHDGSQPGIARFAADMLTRGSGGKTLDELAEELDGLGASVSAAVGREALDLVLTCLPEDVERVFEIAATTLLDPQFPDDQVSIVRGQILSGLRRSRNDTRAEADHMLRGVLFPEGHPYRERVSGSEESVEAISRTDLVGWHARTVGAAGSLVAVGGGISHDRAVELASKYLGGWSGQSSIQEGPTVATPGQPSRHNASIAGKTQADIAIGLLSINRADPDYYALNIANLIFGRLGLMGRIGESVRERQGMAYYAYSGLEAGSLSGIWSARAGVNPANVERAIEAILAELRGYLSDGPTDREMTDAVSFVTGSLPLGLETAGSVAAVLADIGFHDLGLDYLQRYRAIVRSLTADDIVRAARQHILPDALQVVVVGPEE